MLAESKSAVLLLNYHGIIPEAGIEPTLTGSEPVVLTIKRLRKKAKFYLTTIFSQEESMPNMIGVLNRYRSNI